MVCSEIKVNKRNARQVAEINYYLKYRDASYERLVDGAVHVLRYDSDIRGEKKPALTIFLNDSKKVYAGYYYRSEERREEVVAEFVKNAESRIKYKAERAEEKKKVIEVEVGDIVNTSWGYEQTNVDFYQVVEMVGKVSVKLRKVSQRVVRETSWCSSDVTPVKDSFLGDEFVARRCYYGVKIGREYGKKIKEGETCHSSWGY